MTARRFPLAPGFIIGAALIGFLDGIVFHQILQWHHMICIETHCRVRTIETLTRQTLYDGIFHFVMWLALVTGLALLTRALQHGLPFSSRRYWGSALLGAGLFNVVEGIVDHHILQIHHVRFGPTQTIWDGTFLAAGLLVAVAGSRMARSRES